MHWHERGCTASLDLSFHLQARKEQRADKSWQSLGTP